MGLRRRPCPPCVALLACVARLLLTRAQDTADGVGTTDVDKNANGGSPRKDPTLFHDPFDPKSHPAIAYGNDEPVIIGLGYQWIGTSQRHETAMRPFRPVGQAQADLREAKERAPRVYIGAAQRECFLVQEYTTDNQAVCDIEPIEKAGHNALYNHLAVKLVTSFGMAAACEVWSPTGRRLTCTVEWDLYRASDGVATTTAVPETKLGELMLEGGPKACGYPHLRVYLTGRGFTTPPLSNSSAAT